MPLTVITPARAPVRRIRMRPQDRGNDLASLLFGAVNKGFDTFDRRDLLEQQQQNFLEVLQLQAQQQREQSQTAFERQQQVTAEQREFDAPFREQLFQSQEQQLGALRTQTQLLQDAAARETRGARLDEAALSGDIATREATRAQAPIFRREQKAQEVGGGAQATLFRDIDNFLQGIGKPERFGELGESGAIEAMRLALQERLVTQANELQSSAQLTGGEPFVRRTNLDQLEQFRGLLDERRATPFLRRIIGAPPGNPKLREFGGGVSDVIGQFLKTSIPGRLREGAFDEETRLQNLLQEALAPSRAEQKSILNERSGGGPIPLAPEEERGPLFDLSAPNETIETQDVFGPLNDPSALGPIGGGIGSELARRTLLEAGLIGGFA